MQPKEKANQLFSKFYFALDKDGFHSTSRYRARECIYIALDEIISQLEHIDTSLTDNNKELKYWHEVKKESKKIRV